MAEARPVTRSTNSHPPRCHSRRGAESSGRPSFTRNTRRTTNNRSVTSWGALSTYSLTRPVDNERADLDRGHLAVRARAAVPRHHHPFPECDHTDLSRRLGNTREKYPEQQQHRKLESQTPLHNTSLEAANILNKVTAHI